MDANGKIAEDYEIISPKPDLEIKVTEEKPFTVTCVTDINIFEKV